MPICVNYWEVVPADMLPSYGFRPLDRVTTLQSVAVFAISNDMVYYDPLYFRGVSINPQNGRFYLYASEVGWLRGFIFCGAKPGEGVWLLVKGWIEKGRSFAEEIVWR